MTPDATEEAAGNSSNPYIAETLRIAAAGEDLARALELVGWLMIVAATAIAGVTAQAFLNTEDELREVVGTAAVIADVGGVLGCVISAAVFFGFATLVRNSSRSLTLLALDSPLAD